MSLRKLVFSLLLCAAVIAIFRPPEFLRLKERKALAWLVEAERYDAARWVAWAMQLQDDSIGTTNYHALAFHKAVPLGGRVRKQVSLAADKAWRAMGKRGVGAAYWNLAMFNVKHGRKRARSDSNATGWLKLAARAGVQEAYILLAAGDGEYDRIKRLMEMGDPGALATYASSLNWAESGAERIAVLRRAADAGHVASMTRLGLALYQKSDADPNIQTWFERAALANQTTAAYRLGKCYQDGSLFCGGVQDLALAERWFTRAIGRHVLYQAPRLTVDDSYAIRIGTTARWIVKPHNIRSAAMSELENVRRARKTLESAKKTKATLAD